MARVKQHSQAPHTGGPVQPQETIMEPNPSQPAPTPQNSAPPPAPTTDASVIPEYPREIYDEAHIENGHRDFNERIRAARTPVVKTYVPPPLPPGLVAQTKLEMEAGAKRVAEAEVQRLEQKALAARTPEKWEGKSTPVFRPDNNVEYRGIKSQAQTVSKDALRQPPR